MPHPPIVVDLDAEQIRALAHPLRLRILTALRLEGTATATGLAARLDTNTGKTSYHLRRLSAVGLVEEEENRGNARDRWWRAAHDVNRWSPAEHLDDPDTRAASEWLTNQAGRFSARRHEQWLTSQSDWPAEWIAAADMSDLQLVLRPERLRQLHDDLLEVVWRYLDAHDDPDDGAAECVVQIQSFPQPELELDP